MMVSMFSRCTFIWAQRLQLLPCSVRPCCLLLHLIPAPIIIWIIWQLLLQRLLRRIWAAAAAAAAQHIHCLLPLPFRLTTAPMPAWLPPMIGNCQLDCVLTNLKSHVLTNPIISASQNNVKISSINDFSAEFSVSQRTVATVRHLRNVQ